MAAFPHMMKKRFPPIALILALLALLVAGPIHAGSPGNAWRTFNALDGVRANWIFGSAQTPDGALWFATDQGVLRFDGAWRQMDSAALSGMTLTLLVDQEGALWAGAAHGLAKWQDAGWVLQGAGTELADARINALLAMPDGAIWAGGESGVFVLPPNGSWQRLSGLPLAGADHLALDAEQNIWLAQTAQGNVGKNFFCSRRQDRRFNFAR